MPDHFSLADWDKVKDDVMRKALRAKFTQHEDCKRCGGVFKFFLLSFLTTNPGHSLQLTMPQSLNQQRMMPIGAIMVTAPERIDWANY